MKKLIGERILVSKCDNCNFLSVSLLHLSLPLLLFLQEAKSAQLAIMTVTNVRSAKKLGTSVFAVNVAVVGEVGQGAATYLAVVRATVRPELFIA